MFAGELINTTEGRAVLHTALRLPPDAHLDVDGTGAKQVTARFYAEALLPQAQALAASVQTSGATVNRMAVEMF